MIWPKTKEEARKLLGKKLKVNPGHKEYFDCTVYAFTVDPHTVFLLVYGEGFPGTVTRDSAVASGWEVLENIPSGKCWASLTGTSADLYEIDGEAVKQSSKHKCNCNIMVLMATGCKCGGV